ERPFTHADTEFVKAAMESVNLSVECPPEKIEIVPAPRPIPVLRLRMSGKRARGVSGDLRFRYGDREIDPSDPRLFVIKASNDERSEYWERDFSREAESVDLLYSYAMLDNNYEIFFFLEDDFFVHIVPDLFEKGFIIYITEETGGEQLLQKLSSLDIEFTSGIDWLDLKLCSGGFPVKWKFTQSTPFAVIEDTLYLVDQEFIEKLNRVTAFGRKHQEGYRFHTADFFVLDDLADLAGDSNDPGILRMKRIRDGFSGFHESQYDIPAGFRGRLRGYQMEGYRWLRFLDEFGLGGILADDMGLGKTVQSLALVAALREKRRQDSFLIVAPVSTLENWIREIKRFVPDVPVTLHYGSSRYRGQKAFRPRGIVLTSYSTLLRDISLLNKIDWDLIIYDEVQIMKNYRTKINKAARTLNCRTGIALSGTPVENNLTELWAVMETVIPGLLGKRHHFLETYGDPDVLRKKIQPFILRRTKKEVAADLPEREEIPVYVSMKPDQEKYYRRELETGRDRVISVLNSDKPWMKKFIVFSTLNKLRLIAIDSSLKGGPFESGKLDAVEQRIRDITGRSNKVLVFSQFVRVLRKIEERLTSYNLEYSYIDGAVRNRDKEIKRFQTDPDCRIFLISLRAGGLGINLTAADYVILTDPWWNLSPENQAVDRAHRIGRTGKVTAYRFITRNTVEEKIRELQEQKKKMIDNLFSKPEDVFSKLTREEIIQIFS
ncbi:MAG: DEAD/DEAH box helicase, partial [Spirochaetia bacterium]